MNVSGGLSYLPAKQLLLLESLQQLSCFNLLKLQGKQISSLPNIVDQLIMTRLVMEKLRPLDVKLQYQIEKMSKAAMAQVQEPELQHKPRPDLLDNKLTVEQEEEGKENENKDDNGGKKAAIYRPTKLNAVPYVVA